MVMPVDRPKSASKDELDQVKQMTLQLDVLRRRLGRELNEDLPEGEPQDTSGNFFDRPLLKTASVLNALYVEVSALRAQTQRMRDREAQLRGELMAQKGSHDVERSECGAELASREAELARSQAENVAVRAENAALRQENDGLAHDLRDAQRELSENELEIGMLRRRMQLTARSSSIILN